MERPAGDVGELGADLGVEVEVDGSGPLAVAGNVDGEGSNSRCYLGRTVDCLDVRNLPSAISFDRSFSLILSKAMAK